MLITTENIKDLLLGKCQPRKIVRREWVGGGGGEDGGAFLRLRSMMEFFPSIVRIETKCNILAESNN